MLTKPTAVIISQHTHISSHYAVHFNTMLCVNLISIKPEGGRQRDTTSKTKQKQNKKPYTPILLMNNNAEVLNETLVNQIQQQMKMIIHHDQVGFNSGMQECSMYEN